MPKLSLYHGESLAVVVAGVNGIDLKPIRLRKSLYLLIPMEVAKLIGVSDKTRFVLTLKHGNEVVLMYHKVKNLHEN
jgi:hypothetical protein